jgi:hypothetical protein
MNLLHKIIILLSLSLSILSFQIIAQKNDKIKILDRQTREHIPFTTIIDLGSKTGFYSNPKGEIKRDLLSDSIGISCVGYTSIKIKIYDTTSIVYLDPQNYLISEVSIPAKKYKSSQMGYFKNNVNPSLVKAEGCGTEMAVLIKNKLNQPAILKNIYIAANPKSAKRFNIYHVSVFKINIYEIDKNDRIGKLINQRPLIFTSEVIKKKTIVRIVNNHIVIPENGAFIGIEWLGILNNATKEFEIGDTTIEPFIKLTTKPEGTIVYRRNAISGRKWELFTGNQKLKGLGLTNYIPQISIEVVY